MLALLLLFLSWALGREFYRLMLRPALAPLFNRAPVLVPEWVVREPVAWLSGTLLLGWIVYLVAYLNREGPSPLLWGNAAGVLIGGAAALWHVRFLGSHDAVLPVSRWARWLPAVLATVLMGGFAALCHQALWTEEGRVGAGVSVFSDYGPHLAVMRSFSLGHNFPTEYPHYPDGTARYHFLFQFWAGNLEFLGLPIDWALNVPSILAWGSAVLLLYALAVHLSQSLAGGALAVLFFVFRSGRAGFDFIIEGQGVSTLWTRFWANDRFIGKTAHEDWGLWNQNVYLNQRHLALGLGLLFFALLFGYARLLVESRDRRRWLGWFSVGGWWPENLRSLLAALGLGALIGACGFWNGATVIATLLMLAVVAAFCQHRLEWLVLAAVAGGLCFAENRLFLGPGALAVQPELVFGFLAEKPATWSGVGRYLLDLLGAQPLLVLLAAIGCGVTAFARRAEPERASVRRLPWLWLLVFLAPAGLAFSVRLTPDIAINHKYVMMSVALLNIFVAALIVALWRLSALTRLLAVAGVVVMTFTGCVDLVTIVNKNRRDQAVTADTRAPIHQWIVRHTDPRSRLLTDWFSYHTVLLTGRKIFYGWPYYAWGAGYDTRARESVVKEIYGGTDWPLTLRHLHENRISYVLIDDANRNQTLYSLKESFLREHLTLAFEFGDTVILKVPPRPDLAQPENQSRSP